MKRAEVIPFWRHLKEPATAGDRREVHLPAPKCILMLICFHTHVLLMDWDIFDSQYTLLLTLFSKLSSKCSLRQKLKTEPENHEQWSCEALLKLYTIYFGKMALKETDSNSRENVAHQ